MRCIFPSLLDFRFYLPLLFSQCHTMVENSEEYLEKWWSDVFGKGLQEEFPLHTFLCIDNLKGWIFKFGWILKTPHFPCDCCTFSTPQNGIHLQCHIMFHFFHFFLQVCCQNGTYGSQCKPCKGGSWRPCQGNGKCNVSNQGILLSISFVGASILQCHEFAALTVMNCVWCLCRSSLTDFSSFHCIHQSGSVYPCLYCITIKSYRVSWDSLAAEEIFS